ncbi:hypothetical protein RhiTH_010142 [Rhizoctonia solani]
MSLFTCPNLCMQKVLEQAAQPTLAASKHATQGFLQAQQSSNNGENLELDNLETADIDEAKFEHDTLVVQDVVYQALEQFSALHLLLPTVQELQDAQAIMTTITDV